MSNLAQNEEHPWHRVQKPNKQQAMLLTSCAIAQPASSLEQTRKLS
jgi:hypothetical protein